MTLADFLLARIGEDEERFRRVGDSLHWEGCGHFRYLHEGGMPCTCGFPPRFLAECEAKRQIIGYRQQYDEPETAADKVLFPALGVPLDRVIRILAAVYSDHPDYRSEWKP